MKHHADVNARDKNWQTPLHLAAANNHLKCAGKHYRMQTLSGKNSIHNVIYRVPAILVVYFMLV